MDVNSESFSKKTSLTKRFPKYCTDTELSKVRSLPLSERIFVIKDWNAELQKRVEDVVLKNYFADLDYGATKDHASFLQRFL